MKPEQILNVEEEIFNILENIRMFDFTTYRLNSDGNFYEIFSFNPDYDVCIEISYKPDNIGLHFVSIAQYSKFRPHTIVKTNFFKGKLLLKDIDFIQSLLERILD